MRIKTFSISLLITGFLSIIAGLSHWFLMSLPDSGFDMVLIIIPLISGIAYLVIAISLLKLKRWAYCLGVIIFPITSIAYFKWFVFARYIDLSPKRKEWDILKYLITGDARYFMIFVIIALVFFTWLLILRKHILRITNQRNK